MPVDAIASSHSIYATTPPSMPWRPHVRFMQQRPLSWQKLGSY
ncbi:MAG: hypothetical protein V3Q69_09875 [Burkholderia sp.]